MKRRKVTNYVPLLVVGIVGLLAGGALAFSGSELGPQLLAFGGVITIFSGIMTLINRKK